MTGYVDMKITQGETDTFSFTWKIDDTPVNLSTGWTAAFQVRETFRSDTILLEYDETTITMDADGNVVITFEPGDTSALEIPTAVKPKAIGGLSWYKLGRYNVELTQTGSPDRVTRIIEGDFYLNPEIVR